MGIGYGLAGTALSQDTESVMRYLDSRSDMLDIYMSQEDMLDLFLLLLKRPGSDDKKGIDRYIMNMVRKAEEKKAASDSIDLVAVSKN